MISFSPEHRLELWADTQQQTRKSFNPLGKQYQVPHKNFSQELSICQQIKVVWQIPDISAIRISIIYFCSYYRYLPYKKISIQTGR